jgi:anti-sigma regulatory factor (Ser/Thr protein kinase)
VVDNIVLPGMVMGVAGAGLVAHRAASNAWWLCVADAAEPATQVIGTLRPTTLPSEALAAMAATIHTGPSQRSRVFVAKLELDVCGAWLTVANGCAERPVVIRRAGWVDLRGHPALPFVDPGSHPADDRVGLGPADVLLLHMGRATDENVTSDDELIDMCLRMVGEPVEVLTETVSREMGGQVLALGVPEDLGIEPVERVAKAIGIPAADVRSLGYPLGDLQPDLWKQPPRPPRLARLQLTTDRRSVAGVRSLLDRLLSSWRLDGRVDPHDVKLVATELAANAIVHGSQPETVTVRYLGEVVRIEVIDRSPLQPVSARPSSDALGGRGLHLVEALAAAWGSEQTTDGKLVWCDLAVAATS